MVNSLLQGSYSRLLTSMIFRNFSGFRLAPPIRNPSTPGQLPMSAAFFSLTLPPYRSGISLPVSSERTALRYLCVSVISSVEALTPVPIAQIGSYAICMYGILSAESPSRSFSSCFLNTFFHCQLFLSSRFSPMQSITENPSLSAACIFF